MRGVLLLTLAGIGRFAWDQTRPGDDVLAGHPDRASELDSAATRLAAEEAARSRPLAEGERIDLNRASEIELDRLAGVGPALAARIVADRAASGAFTQVDQLVRVSGIGPATLERLRPQLEARPVPPGWRPPDASASLSPDASTPAPVLLQSGGRGVWENAPRAGSDARPLVDLNRADSLELLQVSGIGPAMAGRILAARRERGRFRSVDELLEIRGVGERTLERLRASLTVRAW